MKHARKHLTRTFAFFIITLVALPLAASSILLFIHLRSTPQMSGSVSLKNLQMPVTITRDSRGVPHIAAKTTEDAYRALGYTLASDRLFQLELHRRLAQGRLGEIFGTPGVEIDKLIRTLGISSYAQPLSLKTQKHPDALTHEVQAFFDGINTFIATQPLPLEFTLLHLQPEPFSLSDSYGLIGYMALSFSQFLKQDALLDQLKNNASIHDALSRSTLSHWVLNEKLDRLGLPQFLGSNAWVIDGKHTESGAPLLANDPHIAHSQPGIWYEAHLSAPDFEIYGYYLPLVPYAVLAHTRNFAWGFTMSMVDDADLYKEKIDWNHKKYFYKNRWLPLRERPEIIKTKDPKKSIEFSVYSTAHGPILNPVLDHPQDAPTNLSLEWALNNPKNDPILSLYLMNNAKSMNAFFESAEFMSAPGLNVLYADKKHISWRPFGDMIIKRPGLDRSELLDGTTSHDEITAYLTDKNRPHILDPKRGYIVSANSHFYGYPKEIQGDWQANDRYDTIVNSIQSKKKWGITDTQSLQSLAFNEKTLSYRQKLVQSLSPQNKSKYATALQLLNNWDGIHSAHSIAATLYETWAKELMLSGWPFDEKSWNRLSDSQKQKTLKLHSFSIQFTQKILEQQPLIQHQTQFIVQSNAAFERAMLALEKNFGNSVHPSNAYEWGNSHTIEFKHAMGRNNALLAFFFNQGPLPSDGGHSDINNQDWNINNNNFLVVSGPSTRRVIDLSHPADSSFGILPQGNSGHHASPYYKSDLEDYLQGHYRQQFMNESDIQKNKRETLVLNPMSH